MIWLLAKYVLKAALRDRLPLVFLLSLMICISLSAFFGSAAIVERDQFAIIFTANSLRLLSVAFLILYISFYFGRAFETRDIDALLTRPISRLRYLLGHYLAFQILVLFFTLLSFLIFVLLIHSYSSLFWIVGLFIELSLISLISIFFGMLCSNGIAAILLSFGLYILGRLSGSLLNIINTSPRGDVLSSVSENIMQLISIIIPRFDLMTQSSWLIYQTEIPIELLITVLIQFFVFTGLVLSAAYYDLIRKQF